MDDSTTVKVLDTSEDLVEEHLDVVGREVLGGDDDFVEVALHQLGNEVDFLKKVDVGGLKIIKILVNKIKKLKITSIPSKQSLVCSINVRKESFY